MRRSDAIRRSRLSVAAARPESFDAPEVFGRTGATAFEVTEK
jgi:hypothetical protein